MNCAHTRWSGRDGYIIDAHVEGLRDRLRRRSMLDVVRFSSRAECAAGASRLRGSLVYVWSLAAF
jgi:hypothetical protein